MVLLAQGAIDAYVEYGLHSWDMAASVVIVREAGGIVIDPSGLFIQSKLCKWFTGSEFNLMSRRVLCAGTLDLATQLSSILTHVDFPIEA